MELYAVQLPGRERRMLERPLRRFPELLEALEPALLPLLDKPFVFFGLRRYEGTPPEVLEHRELMELVLPMLRADFALADAVLPATPVGCRLSAWGGMEDPHVFAESLERWGELTTSEFRVRRFPGRHFFMKTHQDMLLSALHAELSHYLEPRPTA